MSALRSLVIAAVFSAGFVGAAYARDPVFTVRLEAPVAEQTRIIAQNTVWNCEGDTCRARSANGANVRACRQFVRELGARVASYGTDSDALSADELERCNSVAPITQEARN